MKQLIKKLTLKVTSLLFNKKIESFLYEIIEYHTTGLSAKEALRFLFNIDNKLYLLQGRMAVKYGDGTHPKHRHTHYHDFFIKRIHNGEKILDVGCGYGALAFEIAKKIEVEIVGIDVNAKNIQFAINKYSHPRIQYITGDVLIDIPDEYFDVVILSNVLEHLTNRVQFLKKIYIHVNPKRFLIRVPLFEREWQVPLKKELGVAWKLDTTHQTEYTLESFSEELHSAKLKAIHQEVRWGEVWAEVVHHGT
ncbi:MAG: class I SAM-dependent methyltransferase [Chitinispirillia bacterium]|jgi:SAM-dependent methyltransferase